MRACFSALTSSRGRSSIRELPRRLDSRLPMRKSSCRRHQFAVALVAGVIVAGCCDDHVRNVSISLDPNLGIGYYYTWVGDTLTVQLDAVDGAGAVVVGAEVDLLQLENPSDSLATLIRPLREAPAFT